MISWNLFDNPSNIFSTVSKYLLLAENPHRLDSLYPIKYKTQYFLHMQCFVTIRRFIRTNILQHKKI